ncbi:MAG: enolase C-terminal domain-like protein [Verrucomicrobiota bacterium]
MNKAGNIQSIEAFPMEYRTKGYFKFFTTPLGASGRPAVMIKMTTDTGLVGWGQSVPISTWSYETLETSVIALRNYYVPSLIGHPVEDISGAHRIMDKAIRPGLTTGMPITRAGIDFALFDIIGKSRDQSVVEILGGKAGGALDLSWTVNVRSLDDVEKSVDEGMRLGYKDFNVKVAPDPEYDVQVVKRVRAAAPDAFLWCDANTGYDLDSALTAAPQFADLGVQVFESPMPPSRFRDYQTLAKQGAIDIYMDEGVISPDVLEEFIHLRMLNGLAMKPSRCGGLTSNSRMIDLCLENDLKWVGSGLCDPDISLAASLALYRSFSLPTAAVLNGPQFLSETVLKPAFEVVDGAIALPAGPGLGVEVDENRLQELSLRTVKDWKL